VRSAAITALGKRPIEPAEVIPLVSALDVGGAELSGILVVGVEKSVLLAACATVNTPAAKQLAVSLERQSGMPTRACSICMPIGRTPERWTSASLAPPGLGQLTRVRSKEESDNDGQTVWELLRCPSCSNCFAHTYWSMPDLMGMRESWSVARQTLGQIRRENGADFVPDWTDALLADLDNPDPYWRAEAAWELATDWAADQQFARIESELLRRSNIEVPREALYVLRSTTPTISTETLQTLMTSSDQNTCAIATRLLALQQGNLDDQPLDSRENIYTAELLVKRGAPVSAQFAARVLDLTLMATEYKWAFDSLAEEATFLPAHLPATLARLRSAIADPTTRSRALELVKTLAKRSLLDEATRDIALQQYQTDLEATVDIALAEPSRPMPRALAIAALRAGYSSVIEHVGAAAARDEDVSWAIEPLGVAARRFPEAYYASPMLDKLAIRGIDLSTAVADLRVTVDTATGYSAQHATYALVRHHLKRGETDAVLALLAHSSASIRGAAIEPLVDRDIELPPAILARLREIADEPAWYPRGCAERALRARSTGI